MKKFYSLLAAAALALSASAATPKATTIATFGDEPLLMRSASNSMEFKSLKPAVKPAPPTTGDKVELAGEYEMSFTWIDAGDQTGSSATQDAMTVTLEKDATDATGNTFLINGFMDGYFPESAGSQNPAVLAPLKVKYSPLSKTLVAPAKQLLFTFTQSAQQIQVYAVGTDSEGRFDDSLDITFAVDSKNGKNTITLAKGAIFFGQKSTNGYMGFGYIMNISISNADYSLSATPDQTCYGENSTSAKFNITKGSDIPSVMYMMFGPAGVIGQAAVWTEGQTIEVPFSTTGSYSLFLIGFDAQTFDPNKLEETALAITETSVIFEPEEADKWESVGTGKFTDLCFAYSYVGKTPAAYDVEVQQNKANPAVIRVVNPYGATFQTAFTALAPTQITSEMFMFDNTHKHFIVFHLDNPERVYFDDASTGLDFLGEGVAKIRSAAIYLLNNTNYDENTIAQAGYFGKFADNKITFKKETIFATWPGDDILYQNAAEGVMLALPDNFDSGIGSINADENAPVEYFNLQGVRVDNPTSGLYIKRQGSKTTKVLVK